MSFKQLLFKILGIKNESLFFRYFVIVILITKLGFSLPTPDPVSTASALGGIGATAYLLENHDTEK